MYFHYLGSLISPFWERDLTAEKESESGVLSGHMWLWPSHPLWVAARHTAEMAGLGAWVKGRKRSDSPREFILLLLLLDFFIMWLQFRVFSLFNSLLLFETMQLVFFKQTCQLKACLSISAISRSGHMN